MNRTSTLLLPVMPPTAAGMLRLKNAISTFGAVGSTIPEETNITSHDDADTLIQEAEAEAEDEVPPLASTAAQPDAALPPWMRELNNSHTTRHSRASSIVSTRTKFSTTTLQDDARSIDINVAGHYFRISRDGSRIRADPPPPYTGPGEPIPFRMMPESSVDTVGLESTSVSLSGTGESGPYDDDGEDGARTPRSTFAVLDMVGMQRAGLDHMDLDLSTPIQPGRQGSSAILASLARADDINDVLVGDAFWETAEDRATHSVQVTTSPPCDTDTSTTPSSDQATTPLTGGFDTSITPSSPPTAIVGQVRNEPRIESMGRMADPSPEHLTPVTWNQDIARTPVSTATNIIGPDSPTAELPSAETNDRDTEPPLSMDDENDISLHYARMMRKLDYSHRKALHLKDKELAELREKLHEKDIVLRQQLRAKDFMIDDLKKRLSNMEENVETMLEKARNQVEDNMVSTFSSMLKDRNAQLLDRIKRVEEDALKVVQTQQTIRPRCLSLRSTENLH